MTASSKLLLWLTLVLIMSACSSAPSGAGQTAPAPEPPRTEQRLIETSKTSTPAPTAAEWTATEKGVGPIHAGMTLAEAEQVFKNSFKIPDLEAGDRCYYVKPPDGPAGISLMVFDGHIARVDVESASIATAAGARVGDREERIKALYPGQVRVEPHNYREGGHYLIIAPGDGSFRIRFETDGTKVTGYQVGRMPEVEFTEGCA